MRAALAAAVAAALVGIPAVPAGATVDHCPAGVADVRGSNPSWPQIAALLDAAAAEHGVPAAVLKAIALRESEWTQFLPDGRVLVSADSVCGLGVMQITADDRTDAVQLASDVSYNIGEGAKILRAKWELSQQTPPPAGAGPDDPDVLENWYYAICLYNGCGSDDTYARQVAGMVADPFRRVPWYLWRWLRPAGFTLPTEADPAYVFPSAFQARHTASGGEFVFYDHTTGIVTKTVPARTHRASAPPVIGYGPLTLGPDMPPGSGDHVVCGVCTGWRLAEGVGIAGRAHWTNSVTTAPQSSVTWYVQRSGRQRVKVFVPAIGSDTLGRATYRIRRTLAETPHLAVPIDQNAVKGRWVVLGDHNLESGGKVYLNDGSSVAGQKLVADAVRFVPVPELRVATSPAVVAYGQWHHLALTLTAPPGVSVAGRPVKVYRRVAGTTAWQLAGTWTTNSSGVIRLTPRPYANMEYTARFVSPTPELVTDGIGNVARTNVRQLVRAALSRTSIRSGETVSLSTSVAPGHAGQPVHLQRLYGGVWRTVLSRTLSSSSTATFTFRLAQPCCSVTDYRFRVYKPADQDHLLGLSPQLILRVTS